MTASKHDLEWPKPAACSSTPEWLNEAVTKSSNMPRQKQNSSIQFDWQLN